MSSSLKNPSSPPHPFPDPPAVIPLRHEVEVIGDDAETSGTIRPVRPLEPFPTLLTMTWPPVPPSPPVAVAFPPAALEFPPLALDLAPDVDAALARDSDLLLDAEPLIAAEFAALFPPPGCS